MSFHIKCFFGKHDWETINTISEREILESLGGELSELVESKIKILNYRANNLPLSVKDGPLYSQKICLKCCAVKDEVLEYIRRVTNENIGVEFEKFHTERRQKQAKSMSEKCAADKFVRI
jgi:hypothetical protein